MWTSLWHTKTMLHVSFKFIYLLMRLLMLLPAQHLLPLYRPLKRANKKSECTCLTNVKAIPIHEVQKLLCVDAAASDAENLCMWCLASRVNIFWEFLLQNLWNNSARLKLRSRLSVALKRLRIKQLTYNVSLINRTQKKIFFSCHRNLLRIGNVGQELSLFVIKLTILMRKIIQRFTTSESDLFSSFGFLHV